MKTKPKTTIREYLLLFGLFILVALKGFSQYQPIDDLVIEKRKIDDRVKKTVRYIILLKYENHT